MQTCRALDGSVAFACFSEIDSVLVDDGSVLGNSAVR